MRRRFLNNKESFNYRDYMTIEALVDGVTVIMPQNVEYNIGEGWVTIKSGVYTPALSKGQYISFRGHLLSGRFGTIQINGSCSLRGNCMSLIGKSSPHIGAFVQLFANCPIIEVESGFLPATTLASGCYRYMFNSCGSLTTAPALPATTLTDYCYYGMFSGCTNLTSAPSTLPATTLANYCYGEMFYGCTSLTTAPELPATTLATNCYDSMFRGCTSLTTAPELPATTLARSCYHGMFYGCKKLNYIKMLATDISASSCLYNWVSGVASTGTFVKNPDATWDRVGVDGVPSGWTVKFDGEE